MRPWGRFTPPLETVLPHKYDQPLPSAETLCDKLLNPVFSGRVKARHLETPHSCLNEPSPLNGSPSAACIPPGRVKHGRGGSSPLGLTPLPGGSGPGEPPPEPTAVDSAGGSAWSTKPCSALQTHALTSPLLPVCPACTVVNRRFPWGDYGGFAGGGRSQCHALCPCANLLVFGLFSLAGGSKLLL